MSVLARLREWQERRRQLKTWRFIGFVTGKRHWVADDGSRQPGGLSIEVHSLYERGDGLRRVETSGGELGSPHAIQARSLAYAWQGGGPLPPLDDGSGGTPSRPEVRPRAKLIPITGGKGAA